MILSRWCTFISRFAKKIPLIPLCKGGRAFAQRESLPLFEKEGPGEILADKERNST
jgi:hypothetical protein